jgi:hypothetical protein
MQLSIHPAPAAVPRIVIHEPTLALKFFNWCGTQEKYRIGWLATSIVVHGCLLTPVTLFIIYLGGLNLTFFILAMSAMGMSLVTNLAAMPAKVTIPVFFLSILIDIIIACLAISNLL